jgi:nicotinamide-nucleotide amidase
VPEVRAGILITGTEVITGEISDRNGPWISQRLGELGVEVAQMLVIGDRPDDLAGGLSFLRQQGVDLIVTSGGLGPTADDMTAEVVADFAGRELVLDEEMEEKIAAILEGFARRFRFDRDSLREANRKQAMVPGGAVALDPAGTAPGLVVPAGEQVVIVLPGPPRELQALWGPALATEPARAVLERAAPYRQLAMRLFAVPESELAATLREIGGEVDLSPLEIVTCLRGGELYVDVRYRDGAKEAAEAVRAAIRERHGRFLFSESGERADQVVARLLEGRTIAVGESCTAGLLAARLTERPGSSAYFLGGVVAYSDQAKTELLGVPGELLAEHGAVSRQVGEAMAGGAIERFGADCGVGITGIAGPDGGSEEKPVGYVCISARLTGGEALTRDPVLPGSRDDIRERSVTVALHLLRHLLLGTEPPR